MILIRGFDQEQYARQIKKGIIGFRDMLTTLMYHEQNGYKLSDYYETDLIRMIRNYDIRNLDRYATTPKIREHLTLIFDFFVPYFYLSYFHILNERSEEWLEKNFDDNAHFIFACPRLQTLKPLDDTMWGAHMMGSSMIYLPRETKDIKAEFLTRKAGVLNFVKEEINASEKYGGISGKPFEYMMSALVTICIEAFSRRCSGDYDESENEFRIIYKVPTPYRAEIDCFRAEQEREFSVSIDGIPYSGRIVQGLLDLPCGNRRTSDMFLSTSSPLVATPHTTLKEANDAGRNVVINPHFLPVDIRRSFNDYGYIGNKEQCRQFIAEKL